jgi:chorismate mutase/prephenate dehydratase
MNEKLTKLREKIDAVDESIQQLLNERAQLALDVGKIKRTTEKDNIFYRPEREAKILQKIMERNSGPFSNKQIASIFRNILTACLNLQQQNKVAYLGPEGTYSQSAVFKHFGEETLTLPAPTIERVFREVEADNAYYGVVPIENSSTGIINTTLDILMTSPLKICGEIILPIHHHLLAMKDNLNGVQRVYAHEQSFLQCRQWLEQYLPKVETVQVSSNGLAAKQASMEENAAAIASDFAAQQYGLKILASNIEDNSRNETRFLILGNQRVAKSGNDKTSLLIATPHFPGALLELLKPFADNNVNITLLESRPYRDQNWSYLFFIDIDGHQEDLPVMRTLEQLTQKSELLNILGSYPKVI